MSKKLITFIFIITYLALNSNGQDTINSANNILKIGIKPSFRSFDIEYERRTNKAISYFVAFGPYFALGILESKPIIGWAPFKKGYIVKTGFKYFPISKSANIMSKNFYISAQVSYRFLHFDKITNITEYGESYAENTKETRSQQEFNIGFLPNVGWESNSSKLFFEFQLGLGIRYNYINYTIYDWNTSIYQSNKVHPTLGNHTSHYYQPILLQGMMIKVGYCF